MMPPSSSPRRRRRRRRGFSLLLLGLLLSTASAVEASELPAFREAPVFRNGMDCPKAITASSAEPSTIHIAMTLDATYLRGSIAAVLSVLQHASCPENIVFHFLGADHRRNNLRRVVSSTFPYLRFHIHRFDSQIVRGMISYSIRRALDQPLNYARIYLADLVPADVRRIIYFDSDLIVVDDIAKLWSIDLGPHVLGAPEYCHVNFSTYFTDRSFSSLFTSLIHLYFTDRSDLFAKLKQF
ncbi:hypothetical protein SAY86_008947 [Trapa natans]|uniref:Hexosyltransferase n=1 Tax=Trapa natans TaxID=22666 RepID=A0AAN7KA74_TRANT|nr:hypothetical protein SAY86_008947 [Trapa natans]